MLFLSVSISNTITQMLVFMQQDKISTCPSKVAVISLAALQGLVDLFEAM